MVAILRLDLDDGGYILLETETPNTDIPAEILELENKSIFPSTRTAVQNATRSFGEAIQDAKSAVVTLAKNLRSLSDGPDEIEVTFGLKASGDIGNLMISKASAEANYTVTLKWKHEPKPPQQQVTTKANKRKSFRLDKH